ncbi:MAG: aminoglycoside phosphotransferase family protein [Armatimonadota bacterium]
MHSFEPYLAAWNLTPDGEPIVTHSSRLLPVRDDGAPAMLKIAVEPEEKFGAGLMEWWDGNGAARVLARDGNALLLERATGQRSLVSLAQSGPEGDDEATRILCRAVAALHAPRERPAPEAVPLTNWFRALLSLTATVPHEGILAQCAATARDLLGSPESSVILHGDIHHGNILDFGPRGWLAIDPKRLSGERGFDYANLFCNPDSGTALAPGRLARRVAIVVEESGIEPRRLLQWIVSWAGLSAAWTISDGSPADDTLAVAHAASTELRKR